MPKLKGADKIVQIEKLFKELIKQLMEKELKEGNIFHTQDLADIFEKIEDDLDRLTEYLQN